MRLWLLKIKYVIGLNGDYIKYLLPIVTLFLGYFLNIIVSKYNERKRLENLRNFVDYWCFRSQKSIRKQSEAFQEFINNLESLDNLGGLDIKSYDTQLSVIDSQDERDLTKAFVFSISSFRNPSDIKPHKEFFNFYSGIRGIINNQSSFFEFYEKFKEAMQEVRDEWNEKFSETENNRISIISNYGNDFVNNDFLLRMNKNFNRWGRVPDKGMLEHYEHLIKPMKKLCDEKFNQNLGDESIKMMYKDVSDLEIIYNKFCFNRKDFSEKFKQILKIYNESNKRLNESKNSLIEMKLKIFLNIPIN